MRREASPMVVFSLFSTAWTPTVSPDAMFFCSVTLPLSQAGAKSATTVPPPPLSPPPPPPPQLASARRKKPARIPPRRPCHTVTGFSCSEELRPMPDREQRQVGAVHDTVAVQVGVDVVRGIALDAAEGVPPVEEVPAHHAA